MAQRLPFGLRAYRGAARMLDGLAEGRARRIAAREGLAEDSAGQLLGASSRTRPAGRLVWVHFASGTRSAPLIALADRLREALPDLRFLFTADHLSPRPEVGQTGDVTLLPLDLPGPVAAFLDHWAPDVAILSGRPPGPAMMAEMAARACPAILVDGIRLGSVPGARWFGSGSLRAMFETISTFFVAGEEDAAYLADLGIDPARVQALGFLDDHGFALPCNERERAALAALLAARPVWLAAPVPPAELESIAEAHRSACRFSHRLLLILVPLRPGDGPDYRDRLAELGWRATLRSEGAEPDPDVQVYVADTEGEMGLWYRLAPISFMGGSLLPPGYARDPLEPAALGSAVLFGPNMGPLAGTAVRLAAAGAARAVSGPSDLGPAVGDLLSPDRAALMAHRAWEIVSAGVAVSELAGAAILEALGEKEAVHAGA